MKKLFLLLLIAKITVATGCDKEKLIPEDSGTQKGMVKGRVTDSKGSPMAGVKVVVENTVFYASYVYATTDENGYYQTALPNGSWHASVQIQKHFLDRLYNFELSPDTDDDFSGTEGAVRNFNWKLSGAKLRGNGYYGSSIAVYSEPGFESDMDDVQLTLSPDGPLADGSSGTIIIKKLSDIGGGEDGINDVPLGKYVILANNTVTGETFQIRIRNTGEYKNWVSGIFESGFTGINNYQIVVQIK